MPVTVSCIMFMILLTQRSGFTEKASAPGEHSVEHSNSGEDSIAAKPAKLHGKRSTTTTSTTTTTTTGQPTTSLPACVGLEPCNTNVCQCGVGDKCESLGMFGSICGEFLSQYFPQLGK